MYIALGYWECYRKMLYKNKMFNKISFRCDLVTHIICVFEQKYEQLDNGKMDGPLPGRN